MPLSTDLSISSTASLINEETSVNYGALSSVLVLLGWQDKRPTITQAEEAERVLINTLQADYEQYLAFPDQSSIDDLKISLSAVIDKLEKNRATAAWLAKEASDRLNQDAVGYLSSGESFFGMVTTKFKIFFGSDDAALHEHYTQLAMKYVVELRNLSELYAILKEPAKNPVEHSNNQRRLLQTINFSLPITALNRPCYPTGACDLSVLSDGHSGFVLQGEVGDYYSGYSVDSAGDINGDGVSDIIVRADGAGSGDAGRNYVLFGSRNSTVWSNGVLDLNNLVDGQHGFKLLGQGGQGAVSGGTVSTLGDLNGDGVSDIIIGQYRADPLGQLAGLSYVVFGSKNNTAWGNGIVNLNSLMDGQRGFVLQGESNDWSGYAVNSAGDINSDGLADIVIGAPQSLCSNCDNTGKTYVVFGSSTVNAWGNGFLNLTSLTDGQHGFVLLGDVGDRSGFSVSAAGDINGDGVSDIIVGAPSPYSPLSKGKSYVVFGSNSTTAWGNGVLNVSNLMNGQRGFALVGVEYDQIGEAVSAVGDINGDGISDIIMGAPSASIYKGKSYVIFGSNLSTAWSNGTLDVGSLIDGRRGFVLLGEMSGDRSGFSVSAAGDMNNDGIADLIVGAYQASPSVEKTSAGKSYVVFGSRNSNIWGSGVLNLSNLVNSSAGFVLMGEAINDVSGFSVSSVGDINSDGISDIIVGAYRASPSGRQGAGKSYVVFGVTFPLYFVANYLTLGAEETAHLTPQFLAVASTHPDILINTLRVTIENLAHGYFAFNFTPSVSLNVFYIQNVSDGIIQFIHTGGIFAPRYRVLIDSTLGASLNPIYSEAQINFLGYSPSLINNQLNVNQGLLTILGSSDLSVNDLDNELKELFFIVSNLAHGQFRVYNPNTNITVNTTRFSAQDVLDRNLQFIHDGSRNPPRYLVAVTDGKSTTSSQAATITFNYAPELNVTSFPLILGQRQATTLNAENITVTDVETFKESLVIEVANVSYGYFTYASNPTLSITTFQQLFLTTSEVRFVQNGSVITPTFSLRAFDGLVYSPWQSPQVYLNHRPLLRGVANDQKVTQGEDFSFSLPINLFSDPDVNDTLTYRAQLKGEASLPVGINFAAPRQFSGNLPNTGSFNVEVEASDQRGLTTSTSFILSSQQSKAAYYQAVYSSLSGIAGVGVAVLAYLWLRRRITRHRRDFPFANDLRKVLNLEYYDFSRFDGDTYKTKIGDFLQRLQLKHQEFYTRLTLEEQKSFAICVAEVLIRHDLVSRSDYGGGLFGILCCLNIGWPSQLNVKQFEEQSLEIATEAVAAWKNCDKPLVRWPYHSPTKKEKLKVFCCCAKPSTAGMFSTSSRRTQGTELATLKKHEAVDSFLGVEPVAEQKKPNNFQSRMLSVEQQSRTTIMTAETIAAGLETMTVTMKTVTEKIDNFEETRPLIQPAGNFQ